MRFYSQAHAFYCGVDLHARSMFTHVLDQGGATVFARNLAADPQVFLEAVAPFRQGLVVGCECMFAWYWLADLCEDQAIQFTLGHALYMKAVHGGKAKNDRGLDPTQAPLRPRLDLTRLDWLPRRGPRFANVTEFCRGCPRAEPAPN